MTTPTTNTLISRELTEIFSGLKTSDGDGVKMTRFIGTEQLNMLDPFLLFDAFGSDEPLDYIGGFPSHPHRGFETVSYLLSGLMHHKDSAGNEGIIETGGVQWMTAGKGVVHSEMPAQKDGLLKGFQLWVNLPAKDKMTAPAYQEFPASKIPVEHCNNGTEIRVITGKTNDGTEGVVKNNYVNPIYMDISLNAEQDFEQKLEATDNSFIYVIEGQVEIGTSNKLLNEKNLGVLSKGGLIKVKAIQNKARFLLVSAQPLNEPVARGGPFVMNTAEEIQQAFADFKNNKLVTVLKERDE